MHKNYLVAVSGGVDSVVLLDVLIALQSMAIPPNHDLLRWVNDFAVHSESKLVVAHFDHGTRTDSADDAKFVAKLADAYGLPFEMAREELGVNVSEATARDRRYQFLNQMAKKHQAEIVTAHHRNDLAETVAINLTRGTGWRGLAVLGGDIWRPLLRVSKQEIVDYAKQQGLEWREDSTNQTDVYLRNRLRVKLTDDDIVLQLAALQARQVELRREIERLLGQLSPDSPYSRQFFNNLDDKLAQEFLRVVTGGTLTRPQLIRALGAIRDFRAGAIHQPGGGCELHFTADYFTVQRLAS